MMEFNHDSWNNWILEGYKFVLYRDLGTHIILKPVKEVIPDKLAEDLEVCVFGIREDEISEFADNDIDIKVYCEDLNPD